MNEWSVFICAETTEYHIHVFFFNDTATTEIYTLSLHDALPISGGRGPHRGRSRDVRARVRPVERPARRRASEACSGPRPPLGSLCTTRCVALGVGATGALHARALRNTPRGRVPARASSAPPRSAFLAPSRVKRPRPDPQRHDHLCRRSLVPFQPPIFSMDPDALHNQLERH